MDWLHKEIGTTFSKSWESLPWSRSVQGVRVMSFVSVFEMGYFMPLIVIFCILIVSDIGRVSVSTSLGTSP